VAFSESASTDEPTEYEGVTDHHRHVITDAIVATRRQMEHASEGSCSNDDEMADAVNQLCGADLIDVILTP
jgi:hypothetical protein